MDQGNKGYIVLEDLEAGLKPDRHLQEFVRETSERLEQQRIMDAFHQYGRFTNVTHSTHCNRSIIEEDLTAIKVAYKRSAFIRADGTPPCFVTLLTCGRYKVPQELPHHKRAHSSRT